MIGGLININGVIITLSYSLSAIPIIYIIIIRPLIETKKSLKNSLKRQNIQVHRSNPES